jgi:non-ribosomal peptide synthetase component F
VIVAEVGRKLNDLGRDEHATLFMILLAAFNVLLSAYTDQLDIVVGTDEAGRHHRDLEPLIGFFINHLALRTDLSGNPTFRDLIRRVRETCLGAYAHQDLPFDKLIEVLRPGREAGQTPLFQVLFVMNSRTPEVGFKGRLQVSGVNLAPLASKYEVVLFVADQPSGLATSWAYQADLFDATTIRGLAADFEAILRHVVAAPEATLAELKVLLKEHIALRTDDRVQQQRAANRPGLRAGRRA